MEKIRELTIEGAGPYRVSNVRGIVDLGKFQGEQPHAVRDYSIEDDSFGDVDEFGSYYWQAGHRYYETGNEGFVTEIDVDEFERARFYYEQDCAREMERDEALAQAEALLASALEEDQGRCDSCEACMINGVRCHETGCPVPRKIEDLRMRVQAIEEA